MEQITLSGVVVSAMPIGEYDKRLVILTSHRGKITAFARGARKQTSPYLSGSQPMTFAEFTMYQGRNAYTITGIKVKKYFAGDMTDIDKMSYGMYFLEVADYYAREGLDASDMLNLVYVSMMALLNDSIPDKLVRSIFELKMLVINGEYPNLFSCGNCNAEDKLEAFDKENGMILCKGCHGQGSRYVKLDASTLYTLQYIITANLTKLYTFTITDDVYKKMSVIIRTYFNRIVDKDFKSLEFLENSC